MKNLFTKTIITALLIFIFLKTNAQTFPYILETETDTYTELSEAVELTSVGDLWDDPGYVVPIGFDFEFYGKMYNTLFFYGLGGMVSFEDYNATDTLQLLAPYADDLIDIEEINPNMQSTISYHTVGNIGDRIFKIEWNDVGFYNEVEQLETIVNRVSFQLWLYEANNNVEYRYGPSNIVNTDIIYDYGMETPLLGLSTNYVDNDTTNINFWYLSGNPTDATVVSLADTATFNNENFIPLSAHPADGQVYRFIDLASSTTTPTQNFAIKVYPNIVSDNFFVEISEDVLGKNTQLVLINNLGQKIWGKTFTNLKEEINVSNFPKGIYYVMVINENGKTTKKIFKN